MLYDAAEFGSGGDERDLISRCRGITPFRGSSGDQRCAMLNISSQVKL